MGTESYHGGTEPVGDRKCFCIPRCPYSIPPDVVPHASYRGNHLLSGATFSQLVEGIADCQQAETVQRQPALVEVPDGLRRVAQAVANKQNGARALFRTYSSNSLGVLDRSRLIRLVREVRVLMIQLLGAQLSDLPGVSYGEHHRIFKSSPARRHGGHSITDVGKPHPRLIGFEPAATRCRNTRQ